MDFGNTKILVTGCAGFIGSSLIDRLLDKEALVVGVDNFNDYYDPKIKEENLSGANKNRRFKLYKYDILHLGKLSQIFKKEKPNKIVHLAARAGVRPSIYDPILYANVNVLGTVNLVKLSAEYKIDQFILGSSSSVYGDSQNLPFSENGLCNKIISPYGASKRASEFLVESAFKTYSLKSIILRFFSVYGPRGRPDMAPALFTRAILESRPIEQFGDGESLRDYTYIDDIIDGIIRALETDLDFEIINLGNNHPISLNHLIKIIEKITGKKAKINKIGKQTGDAERTWADIAKAKMLLEWEPKTDMSLGMDEYFQWLKNF